ncbi:MAG: hypothetical protein AB1760_00195 [Pseudomonadota bacterium]
MTEKTSASAVNDDLLEVCRELLQVVEAQANGENPVASAVRPYIDWQAVADRLEAAITKAEGGAQ